MHKLKILFERLFQQLILISETLGSEMFSVNIFKTTFVARRSIEFEPNKM